MSRPMIKICGLTTPETIRAAISAGASHVGLVHFPKSPRHLDIAEAARLRDLVGGDAKAVLLTVDLEPSAMAMIVRAVRPDVVQLHGRESPEALARLRADHPIEIWKALGIKDQAGLEAAARYRDAADLLLYDAPAGMLPGGNGLAMDWRLLERHSHVLPWGLAGGLNAGNVAEAIRQTGAALVDTSSGVESAPGRKDPALIEAFCAAARQAMGQRPS